MKSYKRTAKIALLLATMWVTAAYAPIRAEVPGVINFQGILKDGSGNPVADGSYSVLFTIYDAPAGGSTLWSQTYSVATSSGLFNVLLGSGPTPIPEATFNDTSRYLGIKVGADPEMSPRQPMTSVGYSFVSSQWTSGPQIIYRLDGQVGIGMDNPVGKLGVSVEGSGGPQLGVQTAATSDDANGAVGINSQGNSSSGSTYGIISKAMSGAGDANGGWFWSQSNSGLAYGVYASTQNNVASGIGVYGQCTYGGYGVMGESDYEGLRGYAHSSNWNSVYGTESFGENNAVSGYGIGGYFHGVAPSGTSMGLWGTAANYGLYGTATSNGGYAVFGDNSGNNAIWGGYFTGDVRVTRNLVVDGYTFKTGGGFRIDHPMDPANKYLNHSFVESPDMKNIYDGVVTLDAHGGATIQLPAWFGVLNKDFRYQLTSIGGPQPNLYVAHEVSDNQFGIAGGKPGLKVSWQVTGIRHDAYADAHRIPVEEDKPVAERGTFLHPEEAGVSASLGAHYKLTQELAEARSKREVEEAKRIAVDQQRNSELRNIAKESLHSTPANATGGNKR